MGIGVCHREAAKGGAKQAGHRSARLGIYRERYIEGRNYQVLRHGGECYCRWVERTGAVLGHGCCPMWLATTVRAECRALVPDKN
jgi:hypothetical protein